MDKNTILSEIQVIFRDVMDNDTLVITEKSSAREIEEWDSLSHLRLVFAIEKHFKIKFSTSELSKWKNVGDLLENVSAKLS